MVEHLPFGMALIAVVPMFVIGVLSALKPYKSAKVSEQIDAIGSRRRLSKVRPTWWSVKLTRICGVITTGLSLVFFVMALTL